MSDRQDTEIGQTPERPEGQVCPNPECHLDQRWPGFGGLACPHCATKLVVACSRCDSGAVYEDDEKTPYCSDHDPRQVATDGGSDTGTRQCPACEGDGCLLCDDSGVFGQEADDAE